MSEQIRFTDSEVTTSANTANQKSTIMTVEIPDNEKWFIPDGSLVVMKLKDSSGNDISANSDILFGVEIPADDYPRKLDKNGYGFHARNDLTDQYDDEKNASARLDIDGGGVILREQYKLKLDLTSPDVIDVAECVVEINDVVKGRM